jgi:hypothetical protein
MENTLEKIAQALAGALLPVAEVFDQADDNILGFVEELGYILPSLPPSLKGLQGTGQNLVESLIELRDLRLDTELDSSAEGELALAFARILLQVTDFAVKVSELKSRLGAELPAPFVSDTNIANDFETRLYDYAFWHALDHHAPVARQVLSLIGVLESTHFDEDLAVHRPEYEQKKIRWDRIPLLLSDPGAIFADVYGWGTPDLDTEKLFEVLTDLSFHFLGPAEINYPALSTIQAIAPGAAPDPTQGPDPELRLPLLNQAALTVAVILYSPPKGSPTEPQSLAATLIASGDLGLDLPLHEKLVLEIDSTLTLALGLALVFTPGQAVRMVNDVLSGGSGAPVASGRILLRLVYGKEGEPTRVLTIPGGSFFELDRIYAQTGVDLITSGQFDALVEAGLEGGVFSLNASEADGFLATILPGDGIRTEFDVAVGWTRAGGVYFKGSASLEIQIPTHLQLGPVELESLYLIAGLSGSQIPLEVSTALSANLGPLSASVDRLGLRLIFDFPGSGGNLGPLDLGFEFKPPNGVGLAIDAGVIQGGGYLFFDFDKEEYAGVLELDLSGIVSVKAIGLITTRLPDGSKGFSLLLIITAEFGSPIQLGFGFTLSAVGGLLGLNRTMRLEVIAGGIRDGGINSIMFPQNVVENAPRIISDLKNYFPVEADTFLIGPMVMIGWGTPNLVTVSLGIIIEIPGNIAILGVLKVVLPDEEAALIVIQVNFIGAIEFDKKRLWFFAAIFESRVLFITLEGEMGLLVGWGDDASFVVSVGGFHPAFNPPPLPFGAIARIAISILNTGFARIRVEGYFAVTSNSVQFGARVEIFFGVSAFNIDGHLAFDALFRFSPFYFIISISASLSVKVFGIGLFSVRMRGSLEGPTPWHVEGTGSISLLFFDIDVDFSHTWGEEAETTLPPISVMLLLVAECEKSENWLAVLPSSNQLLVSLRNFEQGATDLILHPVGSLKISQRAVPLGLTIDKVGNQKPSDANHFDIMISTSGIGEKGKIEESFAVGQYFEKSDNELLNAKSFEPMKSGVELSVTGEQYHAPVAVKRVVRYEKIIIDTIFRRFVSKFYTWFSSLFSLFLNGNAVSKSAISYKQQKQLKPYDEQVQVGKTLYTVAYNSDNTTFSEEAMSFTSQVQAQEYMNQQIAGDANLAKQLHVIPQVEMQSVE